MIIFKHVCNRYVAPLDGLIPDKKEKSSMLIKFDTGAANTIISAGSFAGEVISEEELSNKIMPFLNKRPDLVQQNFESVSGNILTGIKAYAKNIKLGGVLIPTFYYYLVIDIGKKALLGDDFISMCNFTHSSCGDICISSFDQNNYEDKYNISNAIDSYELCEIMLQDTDTVTGKKSVLSQEEINSILFSEPKKINM